MSLKNLGETIKEARLAKGLSLRDLEERTGITFSYIGALERGKYMPSPDKISSLATGLDLNCDILLLMAGHAPTEYLQRIGRVGRLTDSHKISEAVIDTDVISKEMIKIPVLGTIKAGYDLLANQQVIGYEIVPKDWVRDGEYFYLKVTGDSMIDDGIKEGYRVLVRRQNYVDNGKVAVVIVNGDEGTLKRVYYENDMVVLQASNSKIPPRVLRLDDVMIQGQVLKVEFDL